jgi:hypothetical protein
MFRRPLVLMMTLWLVSPGLARAEGLTPEQIASIRRDEQAALEKVDKAHGNKKSSELSSDERRRIIEEQQRAIQEVMDKHGVTRKEYARQVARMGPEGNAAVQEAEKVLEAREREAAQAAVRAAEEAKAEEAKGEELPAPEDIPIQRGFSNENPIEVEAAPGAPPIIEEGASPKESEGQSPSP